ncbi:MAG: Na/Pi cotransporter family protein [Clostridiales bacterium]|nr:Na/Pi cotransporter family protein [Clostridiales bacterium]
MGLSNIVVLLGGLGLFLFGMRYMSDGLNQIAGNKLKNMLEKLTRNRFKGFLLGVLVTAIIQSSSATTVMLMGFLNAGIMDLVQATGVIIGANIGTTITAVLIAIDVSAIAPICIFIGMILALFSKKQAKQYAGQIILGFGILFLGLKTMSSDTAMGALKTSTQFQELILKADNPLLGILIGIAICAVLQSSSAAIGVLQTLALQGLIPISFSIYIIIGINVGSAVPLFISAIGAKTNAKRAAFIYFMFDLVGMLLFTPIALFTPAAEFISSLSSNGSVQVAAAHIIFKTVTALVLLPFINVLVKLSQKIIVQKEHETNLRFRYIDKNLDGNMFSTGLQVAKEVERMASLVRTNLDKACKAIISNDLSCERQVYDNEEVINWLNHNITEFLAEMTSHPLSGETSDYVVKLFHVITDLERVGDHAVNIMERTRMIQEEDLGFTEKGAGDIEKMYGMVIELFDKSVECFIKMHMTDDEEHYIHSIEDSIDEMAVTAQDNHVERLRHHECHTASGIVFSKVIQDLERVGDLSYNIAWASRRDKDLIKKI